MVQLYITQVIFQDSTYIFPKHLQSIILHEQLASLQEIQIVVNTLADQPDQYRVVKVTLEVPILDLYLVKRNPTFHLYSLEMLEVQQSSPSTMKLLDLVDRFRFVC